MTRPNKSFHYNAFGWVISSDFTLPLLQESRNQSKNPDIVICTGSVEHADISLTQFRQRFIDDQLRYIVDAGRVITVEPLPGSDASNISSLTVSRLLTVVSYHRGQLPLHASAVRFGDRLVVICGPSGSGKSTLAAMLVERGGQLHEDDMVVVEGSGPYYATGPSASGIKLSEASLLQIGHNAKGLVLANQVEGKYLMALDRKKMSRPQISTIIQMRAGNYEMRHARAAESVSGWKSCIRQPELISEAPDPDALWQHWLNLVASADNLLLSHGGQMEVSARLADTIAQNFSM